MWKDWVAFCLSAAQTRKGTAVETLAALGSRTYAGWADAMALRLDVDTMMAHPHGQTAAILVAVAACVSTLLGRSVVLAVNRMRRAGFVFAMVLNFGTLVLTYAVLGLLVWATGVVLLGGGVSAQHVTWAVLWAVSPLVLGFATAIPILGTLFERGLNLWSVLILWSIIDDVYSTSGWLGGAIALGAWLLTWLLQGLYAPMVARARDWIWRRATGRPLYDSARYILDQASIDGSEAALGLTSADRARVARTHRPLEARGDGAVDGRGGGAVDGRGDGADRAGGPGGRER